MSKSSKASSFLDGLVDEDSDLAQEIADAKAEPVEPEEQFIVHFIGDKPDCVWQYFHKPADGIPYGRLYGYWDEDPDVKGSRKFKEHTSNNLKLMDFETFMENVPPNKNCTKIYESEADFLLELI